MQEDAIPFIPEDSLLELDDVVAAEEIVSWFRHFFVDPADETPYSSEDGGYIYVWGGPYNARWEIEEAFSGRASEEAIEIAVGELEAEGYDWAPSSSHPDQIAAAEEYAEAQQWLQENDPHTIFESAKSKIDKTASELEQLDSNRAFILQMLFAQSFSILEAYLYDRLRRILLNSNEALENYCENYGAMKQIQYSASQVLAGEANVKSAAIGILAKEIFHRFDAVIRLYQHTFDEDFSRSEDVAKALADLKKRLVQRHDCVHRNGYTKDGELNEFAVADIQAVLGSASIFAGAIEQFATNFELTSVDF